MDDLDDLNYFNLFASTCKHAHFGRKTQEYGIYYCDELKDDCNIDKCPYWI